MSISSWMFHSHRIATAVDHFHPNAHRSNILSHCQPGELPQDKALQAEHWP